MNELRTYVLTSGKHKAKDGQQCVMEAETRFWGLRFGDSHPCISKVIGAFCRSMIRLTEPQETSRRQLQGVLREIESGRARLEQA